MSRYGNAAEKIRSALTDARKLCEQLGIAERAQKQRTGLIICCPAHGEKNPSCSVSLGPDGTIRVKCFSCQFSGDALTLIAKVHDMDLKRQFPEVLTMAAQLAGLGRLADELEKDGPAAPLPDRPRTAPVFNEPTYPNAHELAALWAAAQAVTADADVSACLTERLIDPNAVAALDLARALPAKLAVLPRWARYHGVPWTQTGHRLLLPVYDVDGRFASVRAWRVTNGDTPKRLPPGGHKAAELVLANAAVLAWLRHSDALPFAPPPMRLVVVEGEPDFLVRATLNADEPVIGLMSGSWHAGFAQKIPYGSELIVRTHLDDAGNKYANEVFKSVQKSGGIQYHRKAVGVA